MSTGSLDEQPNSILSCRLLHLSRIVVFSALPVILHLDYMEYVDFFRNRPEGGPVVMLSPYPLIPVIVAIAVIVFDLILLWKWSNRREKYEVYTSFMFLAELVLLWVNIRDPYTIPLAPTMEKTILLLGVFLFGLLQMLVIARMRLIIRKAASTE